MSHRMKANNNRTQCIIDDDVTPELVRHGCSDSDRSSSGKSDDETENAPSTVRGEFLMEEEESSFASCLTSRAVQVAVRVRPLLGKETKSCVEALYDQKNVNLHAQNHRLYRKHHSILRIDSLTPASSIPPPKARIGKGTVVSAGSSNNSTATKAASTLTFGYDEVFPDSTTQDDIFQHRVKPLIQRCLSGYNASILAYGQTGSGKTYTMTGPPSSDCDRPIELEGDDSGVIPRAIKELFDGLELKRKEQENDVGDHRCMVEYKYQVKVQFLELYLEELRDLLHDPLKSQPSKINVRAVGNQEPEVLGAIQAPVNSAEEALALLKKGLEKRVVGTTSMNATSSRSHAIFSVQVEQTTSMTGAVSTGTHIKKSQFHFCDLAGSERQKRAHVEGTSEEQQRVLKGEVCQINMGLLALGNVISALGDPKRAKGFVPYRDSKLTLLLKGSLGGNHHTLMIACVSPAVENKEESINCLRYANRAKNITNHVVVNVDRRSQLLDQLQDQMQSLANELLLAYKKDTTGGAAFQNLLESIAAGETGSQAPDRGPYVKRNTAPPSLYSSASGERRSSSNVSIIPRWTRATFLESPSFLLPALVVGPDEKEEEWKARLEEYDRDIKALKTLLGEAKQGLNEVLASERNPPDDGSLSDISEVSFPSRIDTIESFDSHDSHEIRGLRRRLCQRLENLQVGSDDYKSMKQHYERVKEMSSALQQKEDARADIMRRMETIEQQRELSKRILYASAAVYCSVLCCVVSIICRAN